tara:strand:+ start:184 stop:2016 length:1833 start_codon:yes stop_codon:yes gene_type:complete
MKKKFLLFISIILIIVSCEKETVKYLLTTSSEPAEFGTVLPSTREYNAGDTANLIANPADGYVFDSWTGATGDSVTTLVMDSDKTVVGKFKKKQFGLTVNIVGQGTVGQKVIKAGGVTNYTSGTVVELTATPKSGWVFKEWTGSLKGTTNPQQVTIDKAKTVTATFTEIPKYDLTVNIVGQGDVAQKVIKAGGVTSYTSGTIVELTATPKSGWIFKEWSGSLTGTTNPQEITLDKSKSVTATFTQEKKFEFTIINDGLGAVSKKVIKAGSAEYTEGSILELTASANSGWEFVKWAGALSGTDNPKQITLKSKTAVIAVYRNLAPIVLDNDGITLKAKAGTSAGTSYEINGITYTVVDNTMLKSWISAEKDLTKAVTTLVTDMKGLFKGKTTFNTNISSWDVSSVTTMEEMFEGATIFNKDISKWDTNKVTNMDKMFKSATNFNQDLSKWCVTNLTTEPTDFVSGTSCGSENKPKWGTWPDCPLIGKWYLDSWTSENGITRWNDGEKECENYPDELEIKGDDNTYGTYTYRGYICFTNGDQMQTDEDSGYWQYTGDDNKVRVADKQAELNNAPPWKLEYTGDYNYFTIVHTEYNDDQSESWEVTEVWKRKN